MSLRAVCSKGQGLLFNKVITGDGVFSERASWYHDLESASLHWSQRFSPRTLSQTLAELVHTAYAFLAVCAFCLAQ